MCKNQFRSAALATEEEDSWPFVCKIECPIILKKCSVLMWEALPAVWDNGTASLSVCCGAKVEV